jgi:ABC-type protease/lipase transport system fused ATPase/permease subunit
MSRPRTCLVHSTPSPATTEALPFPFLFFPCPHVPCRGVDVMTPAGKMLARQLSLEVQPGHSLLVTGPNGSGKTSVFRWAGCCVRAA